MNASRVVSIGRELISKFQQSVQNLGGIKTEKLTFPQATFSSFSNCNRSLEYNKLNLTPMSSLPVISRGVKIRGNLQLRCKDCYFERKDGIMYVNCASYPRHKQRALLKRPKYYWILTYAFQIVPTDLLTPLTDLIVGKCAVGHRLYRIGYSGVLWPN